MGRAGHRRRDQGTQPVRYLLGRRRPRPTQTRRRHGGERRVADSCSPRAPRHVRSLSPEETALWARVTATIRPLSRDRHDGAAVECNTSTEGDAAKSCAASCRSFGRAAPRTANARCNARRQLGSSAGKRRCSSLTGSFDLHGMNLDGAWRAIDRALDQALARGERLVLLITGHQRSGEPPIRRGAIRAAVHDWLAASRHARRYCGGPRRPSTTRRRRKPLHRHPEENSRPLTLS